MDDPERQEDFDIFGLPPNYYAKYEEEDEDADSGEFYFDSDLNLDAEVEDQLVAAELLRQEKKKLWLVSKLRNSNLLFPGLSGSTLWRKWASQQAGSQASSPV